MGYTSPSTRKKYYWKNRDKVRAQQKLKYNRHKERYTLKQRLYSQKNPESIWNSKLKRSYGITAEDYNRMFEAQGGVCKICKKPETAIIHGKIVRLAVDHNHQTNKVRALLCTNCNIGIGNFQDNPLIARAAADYLEYFIGG